MLWVHVLAVAAVVIALVAVTRSRPPGGRPVGSTRLMTAGRVVLAIAGVVLIGYLALGR